MARKFEMWIQLFVDHQIMELGIVDFSDTSYLIHDIWISVLSCPQLALKLSLAVLKLSVAVLYASKTYF